MTTAAGVRFDVLGFPHVQGNHVVLPVKMKGGRTRHVIREADNVAHREWRNKVRLAAQESWGDAAPLSGPVAIIMTFYRPRPAAHWTAKGNLSLEGERHPWPVTAPDWDKLARSVGDSLTGVVYRDDAQIVEAHVLKEWRQEPGVRIDVWAVRPGE